MKAFVTALSGVAGLLAVALVDLLTGSEIRIFPFYFLPLAFIAWHFGRSAALFASLISSLLWVSTLFVGGWTYSAPYIWIVNFCTQTFAFATISFLVAAMRDAYKREKETARMDLLTGLPNRRGFEEQAEKMLAMCQRHSSPVSLAYIDLDNFKTVNDTESHEAGDDVLKKTATIFRERLRQSDVLGRVGGDEFIVLLPETEHAMAEQVLQILRQALVGDPMLASRGVTASIGAVAFAVPPAALASLVRAADEVMYGVKAEGKNRVEVEIR